MIEEWDSKGCARCRQLWHSGEGLKMIGESFERHSSLHYCDHCQTFWEQTQRYVDTISVARATEIYGIDTVEDRQGVQTEFSPGNPLEDALYKLTKGMLPFNSFVSTFLAAEVFIGSSDNHQPIYSERGGTRFLATFTAAKRVAHVAKRYPSLIVKSGRSLVADLPLGIGIAINPGWSVEFQLQPGDVDLMRNAQN